MADKGEQCLRLIIASPAQSGGQFLLQADETDWASARASLGSWPKFQPDMLAWELGSRTGMVTGPGQQTVFPSCKNDRILH